MSLVNQPSYICLIFCPSHVPIALTVRKQGLTLQVSCLSSKQEGQRTELPPHEALFYFSWFCFCFQNGKPTLGLSDNISLVRMDLMTTQNYREAENSNTQTYSPYGKEHQERCSTHWLKWVWSDLTRSTLISAAEGNLVSFGGIYVHRCVYICMYVHRW